jgi:hypothetical protein
MPAATATRRDTFGASVPDEVSASVVGASPATVGGNGDTGGGFVIEVSSGSVVDFFRHDVNLVLRESDRSFGAPMILRLAARSEVSHSCTDDLKLVRVDACVNPSKVARRPLGENWPKKML